MKKLELIVRKYEKLSHNENNFYIGGGIAESGKFESNRHSNAKNDIGKETLGKVCQLFKLATGEELSSIKEIIHATYPKLEWHHAGALPKQYGGGMKKTYFVKAEEIVFLATNWEQIKQNISIEKENSKKKAELKTAFEKKYGNLFERKRYDELPKFHHIFQREMNGKYGWFKADETYKMETYYSGISFKSKKTLDKYLTL